MGNVTDNLNLFYAQLLERRLQQLGPDLVSRRRHVKTIFAEVLGFRLAVGIGRWREEINDD
jgi:hypothetical protein